VIVELPTISELQHLLHALPRDQFNRTARSVCRLDPDKVAEQVSSWALLALELADVMAVVTPLGEMEQTLLLQQMEPCLTRQLEQLLKVQDEPVFTVRPCLLSLAELRYAAWPDVEQDSLWDTKEAKWIPRLPRPPLYFSAIDVNAVFLFNRTQLLCSRQAGAMVKARRPDYADRDGRPEEHPPAADG
jgi:hypothetical protein